MKKKAMRDAVRPMLTLAIGLLASGCTSSYAVKVMAVSRPPPSARAPTSYRLHTAGATVAEDTLRYQEAAQHIKTALSAQGLYEAVDANSADMIVEVVYGMDAPRVKLEEYQTPVFGNPALPPGQRIDASPIPEKELVGYDQVTHAVLVREKHLSIYGRERTAPDEHTPPREIWRVDASIEDESADLRGYLPILASAAMDQIGHTTDSITTTVHADGDAIRFIRRGL
jgi:hypothetical protein